MLTSAVVCAGAAAKSAAALAFSDEFDALSLDEAETGANNWATRWVAWNVRNLSGNSDDAMKAGPSYVGTGGDSLATLGVGCHEVSGGTLKLYGRQIPAPNQAQFHGFPYVGGMISTELRHWQTYGTFECRAKFSPTKGHHWAMWLLPKDASWPPEIDMVELISANGNYYHNAHGTPPEDDWTLGTGVTYDEVEPPKWVPASYTDWHVFKFVWTPTTMSWYVDNVLKVSRANYVNKPMYFLIAPEIANSWAGDPDGTTVWPMTGEIDYVRIYTGAPAPPLEDFVETWTGTNGDPWNATRWPTIVEESTSVVDIQSNKGSIVPQGASYVHAKAVSDSGDFADFDLTAELQFGSSGEQYHDVFVRSSGQSFNFTTDPANGYKIGAFTEGANSKLTFRPIVNSVRGTEVSVDKAWGTSMWNIRVLCEGTAIKVKAWQGSEPGGWDIEETNASHVSGIIRLASVNGNAATARPIVWDNLTVSEV